MNKKVIQIENIEADEIINRLERMESAINALGEQPRNTVAEQRPDYLTRREVAKLFSISLVTVNNWTRKGILIAYKTGNRVYYKRSEVTTALVQKGGAHV
jgi:excisionase family DNA binding protein